MSLSPQDAEPGEQDGSSCDTSLVIQAQAGDKMAYDQLYTRHARQLCTFLTHMVNDEEKARELTQDTFLKGWCALPQLRYPARFHSWLYRIAINFAHDDWRRAGRFHSEPFAQSEEWIEPACALGPEEQFEAQEKLRCALAALPWNERSCLIFYHLMGFSKAEIAETLGLKESSVVTYLSAGLSALRQLLAGDTH